uniref:Uncharacterized protein n=1 Tax=Utricularia reniformis TaxID=192314 RepID=A0A1Y0B385_9LAMI|nr:hypothetical protein AEK19_MT1688 [Utricularia reniformis]ART31870.1 hypothetical protein AEK19_MT1688 [Utricularia reniformis]
MQLLRIPFFLLGLFLSARSLLLTSIEELVGGSKLHISNLMIESIP